MSIWEDAVLGAKSVTAAVSEKAGKMVDVGRLRLSAAELSRNIAERYEALGKAVYDAKKAGGEVDGLIAAGVNGIDTLYARLDDVNMKIARLREKKYCVHCGATVEENAFFCSRCGSRIENEQEQPVADAASEAESGTTVEPEVEPENAEPDNE